MNKSELEKEKRRKRGREKMTEDVVHASNWLLLLLLLLLVVVVSACKFHPLMDTLKNGGRGLVNWDDQRTDRQTDRKTDKTDRQTDRKRERERDRDRDREGERERERARTSNRAHLDHDPTAPPLRRVDGAHAPVGEVVHVSKLLEVEVEINLLIVKRWKQDKKK